MALRLEPGIGSSKSKPIRKIKKKVIILGDGGVGKTTLLYRYINNVFIDVTKMTIGCDFFVKNQIVIDNKCENRISLLLWDFAGQDRFRFVLNEYTRGASCVLLAFDLNKFNTLKKLYDWVDILKDGGVWGKPIIKFILVGTKKDLVNKSTPAIMQDDIDEIKKDFNIDIYFETSALDRTNVDELFNKIALSMIEQENQKLQNSC